MTEYDKFKNMAIEVAKKLTLVKLTKVVNLTFFMFNEWQIH